MQAQAVCAPPAASCKPREYYLYIDGQKVPVSHEVYREYYRYRDQERYLNRVSKQREISIQHLNSKHVSWEYQDQQNRQREKCRDNQMNAMLDAIEKLNDEDRLLITEVFFNGKTEEELSEALKVSQPVIHRKKARILKNLKKMIEIHAAML